MDTDSSVDDLSVFRLTGLESEVGFSRRIMQYLQKLDYLNKKEYNLIMEEKKFKTVGLYNLTNTCYVNVVLQLLYHNEHLRNAINRVEVDAKFKRISFVHIIQMIFKKLENADSKAVYPVEVIKYLEIDTTQMQDSSEFLETILNELRSHSFMSEFINKNLTGSISTRRTCHQCQYFEERNEDFLFYNIPLVDKSSTNLNHLLKSTLADETLTDCNKYFCKVCNIKQDATQSKLISRLPTTLTFVFCRFIYDQNGLHKNHMNVSFPKELDVSVFGPTEENLKYKLISVVHHSGKLTYCGHYFVDVLKSGKWLSIDDDIVSECNLELVEDNFTSKTAYMIQYQLENLNNCSSASEALEVAKSDVSVYKERLNLCANFVRHRQFLHELLKSEYLKREFIEAWKDDKFPGVLVPTGSIQKFLKSHVVPQQKLVNTLELCVHRKLPSDHRIDCKFIPEKAANFLFRSNVIFMEKSEIFCGVCSFQS